MADPRARWPRVVVVTDRRRLAAAAGAPPERWPELLMAQVRGAIAGGADLVQVREPDLDARALASFLRVLFDEVPECRPHVVINDRLDVALAVEAGGVHLPERAFAVGEARRLAPADRPFVIGRSVHGIDAARQGRGASYLLAGTVLASLSKPPGWRSIGWEGLRAVVEAAAGTPVVAIGGLTDRDVPAVVRAGATGLAAIAHFLPSRVGEVTKDVQERVSTMRLVFDSLKDDTYTRSADR